MEKNNNKNSEVKTKSHCCIDMSRMTGRKITFTSIDSNNDSSIFDINKSLSYIKPKTMINSGFKNQISREKANQRYNKAIVGDFY